MKKISLSGMAAISAAVLLLGGCVSSKKYHASQAEVARMKADSATMAQQASTLNQNLTTLEQKNTSLNHSLDSMNTNYTSLQKSYTYYQDYFNKQQTTAVQIKDELKNNLAPSGITDQDLQQMEGKIYVNLAEKTLFAGNSAVLTSKGKELITNLGQTIKAHDDVEVSVEDLATNMEAGYAVNGESSSNNVNTNTGTRTTSGTTPTGNSDTGIMTTENTTSTDKDINTSGSVSSSKKSTRKHISMLTQTSNTHIAYKAPRKKRIYQASGENRSLTYSNSGKKSSIQSVYSKSTAWNRQNAVATMLYKNGIPNVSVVSHTGQTTTGKNKGIQVVLTPDMKYFYKNISNGQTNHSIGISQ